MHEWPLTVALLVRVSAFGCIGLRDLARFGRRSFLWFFGQFLGKCASKRPISVATTVLSSFHRLNLANKVHTFSATVGEQKRTVSGTRVEHGFEKAALARPRESEDEIEVV